MRFLLQLLADWLWPLRSKPLASGSAPDAYLRPLLVLVVVLLCGPEVFLAADLVALVDLLGAVLFLTAFGVAFRVLGLAALTWIRRILFPTEWAVLMKVRSHPSIVAHGLLLSGVHAPRVSVFCLVALVGTYILLGSDVTHITHSANRLTTGWSGGAMNRVPVVAPQRVAQPER